MDLNLEDETPLERLALLLKEFSRVDDDREPWRVAYPLSEVLLLLTCGVTPKGVSFSVPGAWDCESDLPHVGSVFGDAS